MEQQTRYFRVAEHVFALCATPEQLDQLTNYAPFRTDEIAATNLFIIHVSDEKIPTSEGWKTVHIDRSDDDMPRIEMYNRPNEKLFLLSYCRDGEIVCAIRCSADMRHATLYTVPAYFRFAMDNATMLLFAFCSTKQKTLLFHSSVTVLHDKAYMFLGRSGTGKSTHSMQWKKAFPESWLLNDDNPVLRIGADGIVRVYGSPWSGKTPCYQQANAPVQALVQLAQAPENTIRRLKMTQAYPYILSSVSGLKLEPDMMDSLYESIAELLEKVPVYYLECLPNEAAAQLCAQTC